MTNSVVKVLFLLFHFLYSKIISILLLFLLSLGLKINEQDDDDDCDADFAKNNPSCLFINLFPSQLFFGSHHPIQCPKTVFNQILDVFITLRTVNIYKVGESADFIQSCR